VGKCGFQTNHNVTLFTTKDLVTWTNEGVVFGAEGNLPPNSVLFAPKTVYNANTKQWVMWFNYIVGSFSSSYYGVATSSSAMGPFKVVNKNVQLAQQDNGDQGVFVDEDLQGYVIYTSIALGHGISIERLTANYTHSTQESSGVFGDKNSEAPVLFRRGSIYYAVFGPCCCYCESGSPVNVYTSSSPLGPYTKQAGGPLGASAADTTERFIMSASSDAVYFEDELKFPNTKFHVPECKMCGVNVCSLVVQVNQSYVDKLKPGGDFNCSQYTPKRMFHSQQTDIFAYYDSNFTQQFMYVGDHWQSSPDGLKSHDFTVWAPLNFDADGIVSSPGFLDSFKVDVVGV
jgi:beta-xylosidase